MILGPPQAGMFEESGPGLLGSLNLGGLMRRVRKR
jgi:hypothetical protein